MTSVLNVDTIADKAGSGPVGLTKQSAAKFFADTSADGGTINKSFNLSSLGDTAAGQQTMNYSSSFDGAAYSFLASQGTGNNHTVRIETKGASSQLVRVFDVSSGNNEDSLLNSVAFGDLA